MNWQHLIYFQKVARHEHLTKAAEDLFITSSALSRAISSLEEEIGVVLFEKHGRNIKLNKYGKIFYDYVNTAMKKIKEGTLAIQNLADVKTGTIQVSSIFSVGAYYVPDLIRTFHEKNKDINIELTQKTTQQILHDVLDGVTDIGFCGEFKDDGEFSLINKESIYNEEMTLIVPNSHPLAQRKQVSFEDIKDEIFIGYNNSTGMVHTIYNGIAKKGYPDFKFKTAFKSNEDNNIIGLVRAGLGIAFAVNNPSIYTGGVTVLKLSDLYFIRTIYMVWKKDIFISPAAKTFRCFVLSNIDELSK